MSWTPPAGAILRRDNLSTALSSAGAGVGTISNQNASMIRVIVQLSLISSPTASGCQCVVAPPTGIMDTSYFAGTGDVAGDEPHFLMPSDYITLTWSGGPVSGQGICTYYYYEVPLG